MSDLDMVEQRLRRTFQAVSELPIASLGIETDNLPTRTARSRFPRHLRVVSIAFVAIVVVAVAAVVLAFGPLGSKSKAPIGTSSQGTGIAKSTLQAALNATFNASGYVSTTDSDPTERIITNSPNLTETVDNGLVSEIDVGSTEYIASWSFAERLGYHFGPNHCGPRAMYIKQTAQGFSVSSDSLQGADVVEKKGVFDVSRNGTVTETFVVQNGYVVEMTRIFPSLAKSLTTSFSDVGHPPRILIPRADEVVVAPKSYFKGCPVRLP
jgi:hypothetical protein